MITQTVTCGFCDEALLLDEDSHYCEDREFFEEHTLNGTHRPFQYSASALMEAEAFLTQYPEFKDRNTSLHAHNRIGAYTTPEQEDYLTPVNLNTDDLPVELNYEGELTREDEWDSIHKNRDAYQREVLTYWKDVEPARCTSALYWWSNKPNTPGYPTRYATSPTPKIKVRRQLTLFSLDESYVQKYQGLDYSHDNLARLSFDELQGFASEQLYDLGITEKYQYTLFNIYVGNDQHLHCGLLTLNLAEQKVTCSRKDCYYRTHPLAIPDTTDRSSQELFIHAIIRHGNNHGPDFYRNREDFAFVHALNCDADHKRDKPCNANAPVIQATTESLGGALDFLIRHRKFCADDRCRCTAYYHTLSHHERALQAA